MCRIQWDHGELAAALHHDLGGFRVRPDVELRRRTRIADAVATAHQGDLAQPRGKGRLRTHRRGNIRQRRKRDKADAPRLGGHDGLNEPDDGVFILLFQRGLRQRQMVAVHCEFLARALALGDGVARLRTVRRERGHQRILAAAVNRHLPIGLAAFHHAQCIVRGELQLQIAVDRGHAQQLDLTAQNCQHQSDGVVRTGVNVHDDLSFGHITCFPFRA